MPHEERQENPYDRGLHRAFAAPESGKARGDETVAIPLSERAPAAAAGPQPVEAAQAANQGLDLPADSRYVVLEEVGRGGLGIVYRGRDRDLDREVALKVLDRRLANDAGFVQRFIDEAQVCGRLQHPGIVPVHDLGMDRNERPFFAMKLIAGQTLAELLAARGDATRDRRRFLGIFESVCQTVAYAHERGVVHRDLKPANVMIGTFGEVQVVDWGLAKILSGGEDGMDGPPGSPRQPQDGHGSVAGTVIGTPAYMSPEQARGETDKLDQRSDVFALGAVLCEILTGSPVHSAHGATRDDLIRHAATGDMREVFGRLERSGEDPALVALCKQCLSPTPGDRPGSATDVAAAVGEYLSAVEERARRAQIQAVTARARTRIAVLVSAVAVLVVGIVGSMGYARKATTRADVVFGYLEDVLVSGDPHEVKGANYRVSQLLGDLENHLRLLQDQPATEAAVRRLLGRAYLGLGILDKAERHLGEALAMRRRLSGERDELVAESLTDEAWLLTVQGKYHQALQLFEQARSIATAVAGPENERTANILTMMSSLAHYLGDYRLAVELSQQGLEMRRRLLGDENIPVACSLFYVGRAMFHAGRLAEAEKATRHALAMQRTLLGDEHPSVAASLNNLALVLMDQDRLPEAEQAQELALGMARRLLGEEHIYVAMLLSNEGRLRMLQGRLAEAEQAVQRSLDIRRKLLGNGHPAVAEGLSDLGHVLFVSTRYPEAEAKLRDALAMLRRQGDEHPIMARALNSLARTLHAEARFDEAEQLARQAVEMQRRLLGEENDEVAGSLDCLGMVLFSQRNYREAEQKLRQALDIRRRLGDEHSLVADCEDHLALVLFKQEKLEEAEKLQIEALEARRRLFGEVHPAIASSLNNRAALLQHQGRLPEAEQMFRKSLETSRNMPGDHANIVTGLDNLGYVILVQGRPAEAEPLFVEAIDMGRKLLDASHPQLRACRMHLGDALVDQGKLVEAEAVWQEALGVARGNYPAGHPEIASALACLGSTLLLEGRYADAEPVMRECVAIRTEKLPDSWLTYNAMSLLGGALSGQGRYAEAEPLLLQGYEKLQSTPPNARRKREALERLIAHYEACGRPEAAAEWRKVLEKTGPAGR